MEGTSLLEQFEQDDNTNSWIVTFADMMTLILVFFILLYTLADYEDTAQELDQILNKGFKKIIKLSQD